jgi:2-C-methyl-D-erythritol 4-phosphate cytidylyltransferase
LSASALATAVIAAAGSGERLGAGGPKALVQAAGRPLVAWCLDAFAAAGTVGRAVVAAPPGAEGAIAALAPAGLELDVVAGGATRADSVAAGLKQARTEIVVVHDAARPLVTAALIDALVDRLVAEPGLAGVIAAAPVTDTVKRVEGAGRRIARTERREGLWAAQTPQVFRTEALRAAHAQAAAAEGEATDDAMLVEGAGGEVAIAPAPPSNLKVTTADDLRVAELLLASSGGES